MRKRIYTNLPLFRAGDVTPPESLRGGMEIEKRIHHRIDPNDESITLKDVMEKIEEIQRRHPDLDVFFDGDEYAVCSRPKKKE